MDFVAHSRTLKIYYVLMDSVFTRLSHYGHSRTLYLHSGLFRLRITFRVLACLRLCRINASFRALVPSLARPLVLKLQELVITDLKSRLARYSLIRPKTNQNHQKLVAIFDFFYFYSSGLLLLTDDRQQPT